MAFGPATGLALLDQLVTFPAMQNYHLLPSVRGDFLAKLGRHAEARAEFERAASLTRNERERTLLLDRAAACDQPVTTIADGHATTGVAPTSPSAVRADPATRSRRPASTP
jgi:hypothetical protein